MSDHESELDDDLATEESEGALVWQVVGRGMAYTLSTAIQLAGSMLVLPFLTRLVDPDAFGRVTAAVVVSQVLTPLASLGIGAAITREYFSDGDLGARQILAGSLGIAVLATVVADVSGPLWVQVFDAVEYDATMRLGVYTALPSAVVSAALAILRARDSVIRFVAVAVLGSLGARIVGLLLLAAGDSRPSLYMSGVLTGSGLAAVVALACARPAVPRRTSFPLLKRAVIVGAPVAPHLVAMWVLSAGDRVMVERYAGLEEVGRYQVAYAVGALAILFLTALNNSWGPVIYGVTNDDLRWSVLASTRDSIIVAIAFVIAGVSLASPLALALAAPDRYDPDDLVPIVSAVAIAALPYVFYLVHMRVLFFVRATRSIAWTTPACALLNIGANVVLLPWLGLIGAALSTLIAYVALAAFVAARSRRFARLRPLTRNARYALLAAPCGVMLAAVLPTASPFLVLRVVLSASLLLLLVRSFMSLRAETLALRLLEVVMAASAQIGDRSVGEDSPTYVIAEIGINHNGDVTLAKRLIDAAVLSGCDAVKFQKRTPILCVPEDQREILRETPWGLITYLEYRERVEFGTEEYDEIDAYCRDRGVQWFASCWDVPSVEFLERYGPPCYKIPSAMLTNTELNNTIRTTARPVILSTGMSTMDEVRSAVPEFDHERLLLAHTTSTYPCPPEELNLSTILTLKQEFAVPVGYSGHEVGLQTTLAAVVMGACFVERHLTLDRAMWGTDQAASVEPMGMMRLVRDIRVFEAARGDGVKRVYESELPSLRKLRGTTPTATTQDG